ncbi:MAG: hypothetical protein JOY69_01450 [Candidatus Eremiobacteraeota bacterium]|nr:hypothetical protein [Candidatus Eremiobacteraeota bacterium]
MKLLLATALAVAFLAGCSGGASPSLVPGVAGAAAQPVAGTAAQPMSSTFPLAATDEIVNPDHYPPVQSSCGNHIRIVIAGFVDCRFTQQGNHGGSVKIDTSHLMGLATVSPTSGTTKTDFIVTGVLSGQGYFIVETQTRKMRVVVTVSLP